ncbi:MAG: right-handed parallel beta-helix repeat-containing protein [Bacteroidetes bacterium]|nr:right-handed parallel beta-helix repeat-containing protein [Bacteroidota bacterium]
MKKFFILLISILFTTVLSSQTVLVFHEDLELPSGGDSLVSTADSAGFSTSNFIPWSLSTKLARSGVRSDSNRVQIGKTIYLTSNSFSTTGKANVMLEFAQICKLYNTDGGQVEVSVDGGINWITLNSSQYLGTALLINNKFSESSYNSDWAPGDTNTIPTNAWWKNEKFDISAIAGNQANVKIRFKFTGSGSTASNGRYGWLIDDIKVFASSNELYPPTLSFKNPVLTDSVYVTGPYNVQVFTRDLSGIGNVQLIYNINGGADNSIPMTNISDSTYSADIHSVAYNNTVNYRVISYDIYNNSISSPLAYKTFYVRKGTTTVTVGTGTTTANYSPVYIASSTDANLYSYYTCIIDKTELNTGGKIESLAFNKADLQGYSLSNASLRIYVKGAGAITIAPTNYAEYITALNGATKVYENFAQNLNTAAGWQTFLCNAGSYNITGAENIMVFVEWYRPGNATAAVPFYYTTVAGKASILYGSGAIPTTANTSGYRANIKINFQTSNAAIDASLFNFASPASPMAANQIVPVSVRIKNLGSTALTQLKVHWLVDGQYQGWVPYTPTVALQQDFVGSAVSLGNVNLSVGPHKLRAWTELPNGVADMVPANDTMTLSVFACANMSGTFTVGTTASDFPTLTDVYTALNNCGVSGPVDFKLASGTYNQQLVIPLFNNVSAANTITFESASGNPNDVIFQYSASGATDNYVLRFDGAQYIKVKNITFNATGISNGRVAEYLNTAQYCTIEGCILNMPQTTSANYAGVYSSSSTFEHHNTIKNNVINGGYYGIYFNSSSSLKEVGNVFEGNIIKDFYYYGLNLTYQDSISVNKNIITNSSSASNAYGFFVTYSDNATILKNKVHLNASSTNYCLYLAYSNQNAGNSLVANNWFSQSIGNSTTYGINNLSSKNVNYYYNSVNVTAGTLTSYAFYSSSATGIKLKNNSIVNKVGYAFYISTNTQVDSSNYNNLYSSGANFAFWGTACPNITALQSASGKDQNSMNIDPLYTSFNNLHINNYSLVTMGSSVPNITDDIDGESRSNTPTIGSDEIVIPSVDAGLFRINNPSASILTLNQSIKVSLKHIGAATLTSTTIKWSVNGVMQTPYAWTGNLAQFAVDSVVIGNYTFSYGASTLKVWTEMPNNIQDVFHQNDTISLILYACSGPLSGNYTIGGSGANFPTINSALFALKNCGINAPTTFNINPGTYAEQIIFSQISGASASNTLTFKAANNDSSNVIIDAGNNTAGNFAVKFDASSYYVLNKLTVQNTILAGRAIELINAANNITISNCVVKSNQNTTIASAAPIYSYNTKEDYITISNNLILGGYNGIYMYGVSSTNKELGNIIQNNIVKDFNYYGIYTYAQDGIKIIGNIVQNHPISSTVYALYAGLSDNGQYLKNDFRINATSTSYIMYFTNVNSSAGSSLVANNFISQFDGLGSVYGIYQSTSNNINYYYNSINITKGNLSSNACYLSGGSGNNIVNNNISNTGGGYALYVSSGSSVTACDYNNIYTNVTYYSYWGSACTNLAALKSSSGKNANSIAIDPTYNNITDLHTENVGLWAKGISTTVSDDIDGQTRATLPCIGADEFIAYPNDVKVKALYTFGKLPVLTGSPHNVKAIVKNIGTNNLTNLNLTLNITGANTFTNVKTLAGLLSGAEDTITFDNYTPTVLGLNNVKVSFPFDDNNTNNELNYYQNTTDSIYAYADTSAAITSVGFNSTSGLLLAKYFINSSRLIPSITAFITNNNTVGQTLYAVLLDANANILDTSYHKIITSNDVNSWVTFTMVNKGNTLIANNYAYLGIAQTVGVTGYNPLGSQKEVPARRGAYYTASLTATPLTETTQNGRFMIQANLVVPVMNEASISEIITPISGCGLSNETVKIKIQNGGLAPIYGGQNVLMAHYGIRINGSIVNVVNQQFTDTILPTQSKIFSFATPKNMAVTLADSNFSLVCWIDLLNDPYHSNDTLTKVIKSKYVPNAPVVNTPVTISYGNNIALTANSQDTVKWYANLNDTLPIHQGTTFITPQLFTNTTYYVKATTQTGSNNNLALSAVATHNGGGLTTNGYGPELYNDGIIPPYGSGGGGTWGWTYSAGWIQFTWPSAKNFSKVIFYKDNRPMSTCTFQYWDGSVWVDFYSYNSTAIVDSVAFPVKTSTKLRFYNLYSDQGNPNFDEIQVYEGINQGCISSPVSVLVNVLNGVDATVKKILTPSSACALVNQNLSIRIKNLGNLPIISSANSLTAYYGVKINNNIINVVSQQVPNTLNTGDSIDFTFTTPITLPANTADSNYTLIAWTAVNNDININNDTLTKLVISRFTPIAPITNSVSVSFGNTASLTATSTSPVEWYKTLASDSVIYKGTNYTTPVLYANDTFYVAAITDMQATNLVGTGNVVNTSSTYPTPYGQFYNGSKEQYLIKASELTALGFIAGNITSLGFDVVVPAGAPLTNYTIKIGHTNQTALSTWVSGLTQVYSNVTDTNKVGWNMYNFSTPFVWNGIDNIVVENCFDNYPSGYTTNGIVNQTATPFVSTLDFHSNAGNICATTNSISFSQRPNMKITGNSHGCSSPKIPVNVVVGNIPALDIAISGIIPTPGNIITGTPIAVKAKLYNYGSTTVTSANIKWSVNGVLQGSIPWTGILTTAQNTLINLGNYTFASGPNVIKVWSSAPNSLTDLYPANDTAISNVLGCMGGNFTIGTGGTFPNFAAAINTLNAVGVCGNTIFDVLPGTYNEAITINQISGVGPNATITFRSQNGNNTSVILTNSINTTTLILNACSYIHFEKITISATANSTTAVQVSGGSSYNVFDGNIMYSPNNTTATTSVIVSITTGQDNYNKFLNNTISGGYYSVYWSGASTMKKNGNIFSNNTIKDFSFYGLYINYNDSITVTKNTITNSIASSTAYGIYANNVDRSVFTKNKINLTASGSSYCMYFYFCNSNASGRSLVASNFITQSSGTTVYGIDNIGSNNMNYYYNSINISGATSANYAFYLGSGTACNVVNNIFSNTIGGYAYYVSSPSGILNTDYNDFYSTGSNLAYWGNAQINLTSLQNTSGKDQHSLSVYPNFNSATDLHLMNFDLNGKATPVDTTIDDIDGTARNLTIPDIGADEFNLPLNDAGITVITQPVNPAVLGPQNVKAIIRNFGSANLTSANIQWSINGILKTPLAWTGNLVTGDTTTINLGSYNFPVGYSAIKVWTNLPNAAIDGYAANDTSKLDITVCTGPLTGTYTIGGSTANFPTINAAIQSLYYCGISGPVTFNINPGSYYEQLTIPSVSGASATNMITFKSLNNDSSSVNILYAPALNSYNYVVKLDGAKYIKFKYLTITNISQIALGRVIELANTANFNEISNCKIQTAISISSNTAGIYSNNTPDDHNIITNNLIIGGYYGISFSGISSTSKEVGNTITNNIIKEFYYTGLSLYYQDSLKVFGNILLNEASSSNCYGIYSYYNDNVNIQKNKVMLTNSGTTYSLYLYYNNYGSGNGLVANNCISQSVGIANVYGFYNYYSSNIKYFYNSVNITAGNTTSYGMYFNGMGGNILKNNSIVNSGGGFAIYANTAGLISSSNYNNLFATGATLGYWGANTANFAAWKTASGQDANSVSADPFYIGVNDLHVYTPALNNLGTPLSDVSDDMDGQTRNITTPDIGADEFTPLQKDLAVISIFEPAITYSQAGSNINIKLKIKNFGTDSIGNFQVVFKAGNAAPVSQLYSGFLLSNKSDSVVFTTPLTITAGPILISAYTVLSTDGNHLNDTVKMNYFGVPVKTVPYTENFDGTAEDWFQTGGTMQWQKGIPSSTVIAGAHSAPNAWKTVLNGNYVNNSADYLYSPIFDNSIYKADSLKFWFRIDAETNVDGGRIEYKNMTGGWDVLGTLASTDTNSVNWYNSTSLLMWTGNGQVWQQAKYKISKLTALPNILQFRFVFTSNLTNNNYNGWAIDDFELSLLPISSDAGVINIINPVASFLGDTVYPKVTVKNMGSSPINSIPVKYSLNGLLVASETFNTTLAPGASADYTFNQYFKVLTQPTYTIKAYTSLSGDYFNNADTTTRIINVSPALKDVGILSIISPVDTLASGSVVTVSVKIKNFGTQPLTSIPVTYQRSSLTPVTETWTGPALNFGDSVTYSFTQTLTVPIGTTFPFSAYTELPSDAYPNNNKITKQITISSTLPGNAGNISSTAAYGGDTICFPTSGAIPVTNIYTVPTIGNVTKYVWKYTGSNVSFSPNDTTSTNSVSITFNTNATSGNLTVYGYNTNANGVTSPAFAITVIQNCTLGIDDESMDNFWLSQNMPNPTNGNSIIEYNLPVQGDVSFEIVNMLGQRVYQFHKIIESGKHSISLNAIDMQQGIYYYSITYKGKRLTKKMIINK